MRKVILMNKNIILYLVIILLCIQQYIIAFHGIEFRDTGFYMTFYDNIFNHPESMEYNFMYYLSGIIGGGFMKVFPDSGVIGIRLLGILFNLSTAFVVYYTYRKIVPDKYIIYGILFILFSYISIPISFYNDILTGFLYVLGIALLVKGLLKDYYTYTILSGLFLGINVFSRIPNILGFAFICLIFIYGYYFRKTSYFIYKHSIIFIISFFSGICLILGLMKYLNHLDIFINNFKNVFLLASDSNNTHSFGNLIFAQIKTYGIAVRCIIEIGIIVFLYNRFYKSPYFIIINIILIISSILILYRENPITVVCSAAIIGCIGNIIFNKDNKISFLSWSALLMLLVFPLGSDYGMFNNGSIIYWLATPLIPLFINNPSNKWINKQLFITLCILFIIVCFTKTIHKGLYRDTGNIWNKNHAFTIEELHYIKSDKEKVKLMENIFLQIKKYVHKNDLLLVYDGAPLINYITHTRPFMGCSWPGLISVKHLETELSRCNNEFPSIVIHKFDTTQSDIIPISLSDLYKDKNRGNDKLNVIMRFIEENNYIKAYEDEYIIIYLPNN